MGKQQDVIDKLSSTVYYIPCRIYWNARDNAKTMNETEFTWAQDQSLFGMFIE